jgi:hypothetical protein
MKTLLSGFNPSRLPGRLWSGLALGNQSHFIMKKARAAGKNHFEKK